MGNIGIWLIGARGGVAATSLVGLELLKRSRIEPLGLVSSGPDFAHLDFQPWSHWVVGGHELRSITLESAARQMAEVSRAFPPSWIDEIAPSLADIDREIRPGIVYGVGDTIRKLADEKSTRNAETPRQAIQAIQADLTDFAQRHQLDRVICVNVASTEPPVSTSALPTTWEACQPLLEQPGSPWAASSLYAIAAIELGFPYVNFTPSVGSNLDAIRDLAIQRRVCHVGRDGKTGETFLKSVLAPAFAARQLQVMSWVGHNIFGNMDGVVLNDPVNKATKVASKDKLLSEILGYSPQTLVSIEYIESLGDWKTAWDHIHFRGFLGTPMTMQFTWQGCDSILAAPFVLDLIRFTELAARRGEFGELAFLASFFKSPQGTPEHRFEQQFQQLRQWATK